MVYLSARRLISPTRQYSGALNGLWPKGLGAAAHDLPAVKNLHRWAPGAYPTETYQINMLKSMKKCWM